MVKWRISNYAALSGRGGEPASSRWHDQGIPVGYCCDYPSTTLLEILVQIELSQGPKDFRLLRINCPDDIPYLTSRSADRTSTIQVDT
ncbi:RES family NAD+ phosphorylase [Rhizobium sp. 2YAF20]|uniref:RES family NAD+ phosphorylase n=1 Tax=Rhizobium sp. 2YAF20 TaxID=3233027 RepID=UPI003F95BE8B